MKRSRGDVRTFTLRLPAAPLRARSAISWRADPKPQANNVAEKKPLETIAAGRAEIFRSRRRRSPGIPARSEGRRPLSRRDARASRDAASRSARASCRASARARTTAPATTVSCRPICAPATIAWSCSAKEATGRLGLSATPAPMLTTGVLTADGGVRATLADGRGAMRRSIFAKPASTSRPLRPRPRFSRATGGCRRLADDRPRSDDAPRHQARARQISPRRAAGRRRRAHGRASAAGRGTPAPEGHGPHPLAFGAEQKFQWREPQGKDPPRTPDAWTFALSGESTVDLTITEGMVGEIIRGDKESVGKFVASRPFSGKLAAGRVSGRGARARPRRPSRLHAVAVVGRIAAGRAALRRASGETRFRHRRGSRRQSHDLRPHRPQGRAEGRQWRDRRTARRPQRRLEHRAVAQARSRALHARIARDDRKRRVLRRDAGSRRRGRGGEGAATGRNGRRDSPRPAQGGRAAAVAAGYRRIGGRPASPSVHIAADESQLAATGRGARLHRTRAVDRNARWTGCAVARRRFRARPAPLLAWPVGKTDKAQWRASVWSIDGASTPISIVARSVSADAQDAAP